MTDEKTLLVGIVMGSDSDWNVMREVTKVFDEFDIQYEAKVISAHRTPDEMYDYAKKAKGRGIKYIIAGAGGAAHLPGMIASSTEIPVLGVPIPTKHLEGNDSLLSIVQMPKGIPVATFAIGEAGAINSALFVISMISTHNEDVEKKLVKYREKQKKKVLEMKLDS